MPQPLSSVLKNPKHLEIGCLGRPVLSQRPQLAVMAMEAIAAWAHVENFMMLTYIELAGGAGADAAAAYMALDGTGPKMAVVRQLASRKLSVENQALLQAILALVKSAQRQRDKLAHWTWGVSDDLPEALLLNDPKQLTFDPANVLVYSESDFKSMYDHFHKIGGFSIKFRFVISGNPANQGGRLYDALCEEPEIAEKLNRPKAPKG